MNVVPPLTPRPVPVAPSEERWREMTKDERERFILETNEILWERNLAKIAEIFTTRAEEAKRDIQRMHSMMRASIVTLMAQRGINCSPDALRRLNACTDPDELYLWIVRALTASSETDVFMGEDKP